MAGWNNPAGGLSWHLTAWQQHQTLWQPYAQVVAAALDAWQPAGDELVWVGPSAGWLMAPGFLSRFQRVHVVEPDPIARFLLRRRFPGVRFVDVTEDYFTPQGPLPWRDNLARFFHDFADQPLLFAEFLGQLLALWPEAVGVEVGGQLQATPLFGLWKDALRGHLAARSYFSSHDALVAATSPAPPLLDLPAELSRPDLLRQFWPDGTVAADPLTAGLLPPGPRRMAAWQRLPQRWHLMELAWHRPP